MGKNAGQLHKEKKKRIYNLFLSKGVEQGLQPWLVLK